MKLSNECILCMQKALQSLVGQGKNLSSNPGKILQVKEVDQRPSFGTWLCNMFLSYCLVPLHSFIFAMQWQVDIFSILAMDPFYDKIVRGFS